MSDPILEPPPADDDDDEEVAYQPRRLVFAAHHTARDIPALLKRAQLLRVSGQGPEALRLLAEVEIVATEFVLSDRICACGGYRDDDGRCWDCIKRAGAQQRCVETAAAIDPVCEF